MAEEKMIRLSQVARNLNVGISTVVEHLNKKGITIENSPNAKLPNSEFEKLQKVFASSAMDKKEASTLRIGKSQENKEVKKESIKAPVSKSEDAPKPDVSKKTDTETTKKEAVVDTPKAVAKKPEAKEEKPAPEKKEPVEEKKPASKVETKAKAKTETKVETKDVVKAEAKVVTKDEGKSETKVEAKETKKENPTEAESGQLKGLKVLGKIELEQPKTSKKTKPKTKPNSNKPKQETKPVNSSKDKVTSKENDGKGNKKPEEINTKSESKNTNIKTKTSTPATKPKSNTPNKPVDNKPKSATETKAKPEDKTTTPPTESKEPVKTELIEAKADALKGLTVLGKIELPADSRKGGKKKPAKPVASSDEKKNNNKKRRQRKRIVNKPDGSPANAAGKDATAKPGTPGANKPSDNRSGGGGVGRPQHNRSGGGGVGRPLAGGPNNRRKKRPDNRGAAKAPTPELSDKQIQEQIKQTLAKLSGGTKANTGARSKYRKDKRGKVAELQEKKDLQAQEEATLLQVTEFISASDLASLMGVSVNEVISTCLTMGMFVSINQRLDAEAISLIGEEFGFEVKFTTADDETDVKEIEDKEEDLIGRAPIVTIMGHVDHGKTSLLDYIRSSKVTEKEAGGITQHIGAYDVITNSDKRVAFLDTPGHEAFTAMRARGAKLTDVAIIVVAADDNVMPQTKEAINHAQVAGVPIVIAINKIDKPNANVHKIKEELANINILVEDWGGKFQCQEISAKTGAGIDELLEKVLLEAELLELKANPEKQAVGTVVEASLDKGRGYVATVLVQAGTLKVGDVMLAGSHYGKVKAMFDHRGQNLKTCPPSTPVLVLGLDGAPQAGDKFNVMNTDREARDIATKRLQIQREQSIRTKKHITLDEIGRRLAIGSFKELNVIVKGDVDGSVEALSDSLLKLSSEQIQVNIIHKGVGQISESDVLLASASDGIIVGFQVRPSASARKIAENEQIEIRLYSIIYDAINEVKDAMEGMLEPEFEEIITGNAEVRDVFKISKVGTVAGCYVTDGYLKRNNNIRLIREGIVVYSGELGQLKRFKDDVTEVKNNFECGLSIKGFNDIKMGDVIESYEERELKRKL